MVRISTPRPETENGISYDVNAPLLTFQDENADIYEGCFYKNSVEYNCLTATIFNEEDNTASSYHLIDNDKNGSYEAFCFEYIRENSIESWIDKDFDGKFDNYYSNQVIMPSSLNASGGGGAVIIIW